MKDYNKYIVSLQHDKGIFNLTVLALSKKMAIEMALKAENAPQSAVIKVKKVNKSYAELKAEKRQEAIDIQNEIANESLSYGGMAIISDYLKKIGKRYGLLKEFRENGLI